MGYMQLKQSESTAARRRIMFVAVDATDGYTKETGLSSGWTIEISKNGASQAAGSGSITEIGDGEYYYEATQGELDTLGFLAISIRHANIRDVDAEVQVVAFDPYSALATASALTTHDGKLDTVDTVVDAIKAKTDNLPNDPTSETNATSNKNSITTEVNANEVKIDTVDTVVDAIKSKTDNLPADPASNTEVNANETKIDTIDTVVDAIKAKTDNLPLSPAPVGEYDSELAAIQADLDNPNQYKADVSGLAIEANATSNKNAIITEVNANETKIDTIDTVVDAIKVKTDNLPTNTETEIIKLKGLAGVWLVAEYHYDVNGDNDYIQFWQYGNQTDFDNETKANAINKWRIDATYSSNKPTKIKFDKVT